ARTRRGSAESVLLTASRGGLGPLAARLAARDAAPTEGQAKGLGETMNAIANVKDEAERISAWQCIGCGRIEGPQPCVGVCQDKKVTFVSAEAYDAVAARL